MSGFVKDIVLELRQKYRVDEYFYPAISMDIDVPNSLAGEVNRISQLLKKNGFKVNSENVFSIMKLKKLLLKRYNETVEGKSLKVFYNRMMLEDIKPIGITLPINLLLVSGIVLLSLFVASRFLGSFADEAGKIAARKLLGDEKKNAKEHNMTLKEYNFLKNQTIIWIEKGNGLNIIRNLHREENDKDT